MKVDLIGGWGYNNLGDEAILAGYIELLSDVSEVSVASVDVARTAHAQRPGIRVRPEGRPSRGDAAILCGGGYLNGSWVPEIFGKLRRQRRDMGSAPVRVVSSVEVRGMASGRRARLLRNTLSGSAVSVRDVQSQQELRRLGIESEVMPDAIALLWPYLDRYQTPVPEARGKVLINLLDIGRRPDAGESEVDPTEFIRLADELIDSLGDRAVGLVIGDGDLAFMRRYRHLQLATPRSVTDLVSLIGEADAVLSVRMHPGLIASAMGTPVVAIPYCGKVRPTLQRIGVADSILVELDRSRVDRQLRTVVDRSARWREAHNLKKDWLLARLGMAPSAS
ncbi:hypothetical protein ET445_16585 [Agromyces protaetiae]|uniref:Polysaccharide pyruvyl transferase domain-containing protein n=1 Tax=Agromyces protaetiae TaxID=2509455 RepID=A0A4P6FEZ8_9MICO|nr:polysaccharide pyruvyl transferase family protein [Agromyces protaetiae]QAY74712.1 hypothetical protein ET445_16585 [Agromyces protaetiae]